MPRRPRRAKARAGLTQEQREDLLFGMSLDYEPWGEPAFASPLQRRAAWYGHREELMAEWESAERDPFARPAGMVDFEIELKHPRGVVTCTDCGIRATPNASEHHPHDVPEPWPAFLIRTNEASALERGYYEVERRERAEREDAFRRSVEEYQATRRARSEPGAVVSITDRPMRVPGPGAA